MKKLFASLLVLSIVCSAMALDGTVVSVNGKVERQSGDKWIPLAKGDIIPKGTIISTGFKSEAVIKLGESTVTMSPLSRLTLEQLANLNGNHKTQVYLDCGSIKANVKAAEDKKVGFTVKSPVATASVRGTEFTTDGATFNVDHGIVAISAPLPKGIAEDIASTTEDPSQDALNENGAGVQVMVKAGESSSMGSDGNIAGPQAMAVAASNPNVASMQTLSATASVTVNTPIANTNTGSITITPVWPD